MEYSVHSAATLLAIHFEGCFTLVRFTSASKYVLYVFMLVSRRIRNVLIKNPCSIMLELLYELSDICMQL